MPVTYSVGQEILLTTFFISHDETSDEEEIIFPISVDGVVEKFNETTSIYEPFDTFTPTSGAGGEYSYPWLAPANGKFKVSFEAVFDGGQEATSSKIIIIGPLDSTDTLNSNQTYYYLGALDPLYLDPEVVLSYYAEGDLVEITELIHWYSKKLLSLLNKTTNTIGEITPLMQEYILASVLCDLSRIYMFDGGLAGFSSAGGFQLGDLQIKEGGGSGSGTGLAGAASTWCELASLLEYCLIASKNGMKAIVKGCNFPNPIPRRKLKRAD